MKAVLVPNIPIAALSSIRYTRKTAELQKSSHKAFSRGEAYLGKSLIDNYLKKLGYTTEMATQLNTPTDHI